MKKGTFKPNAKVIYLVMALLASLMHFYKLGSIPYGLHIDEAGMAYDAFCLANYSVDRYLNHLPVYLVNFGNGQSALYAYITAILNEGSPGQALKRLLGLRTFGSPAAQTLASHTSFAGM